MTTTVNSQYRERLAGTDLDYFNAPAAVNAIQPGAWAKLPYTSRVLAEQLVRCCDPADLTASLEQLIYRKRDLDFPWYPARVVCHDILGQTALVDLAGLRDAIAEKGGDPAKVNPVVPTQLIVDHSLAVEAAGFDPDAFEKNRAIEDRRNEDRFHFIEWTKTAFKNVDVIPAGNGIMHQINLEKMSPVVQARGGIAFPDTCVGTDSHTPHVDALGVIAVGVGGLEAETVMLGHPSMMRLPDIVGVELTGKRQPGITATDIVLAITEFLRQERVVGAYVEFFGEGADSLTIGDRATISNMCPEYGATASMFYIDGQTIVVKGPKGERSWTVAEEIEVTQGDDGLNLAPRADTQRARAMWGLSRALVDNMVTGVTEGFERTLELVGVGYRAALKGQSLSLQLGFSHEIDIAPPAGITFAVPKQTEVKISGNDKQAVGQIAAVIRKLRPPEPYKGKGVRYAGEKVRRKEGKKK